MPLQTFPKFHLLENVGKEGQRGLDLGQFLTLETFHDRCLVLVLKFSRLTSSTFQHFNISAAGPIQTETFTIPRCIIIAHPSVSGCLVSDRNAWQSSTARLSALGQTSCYCC